jgi:hypothetical protein
MSQISHESVIASQTSRPQLCLVGCGHYFRVCSLVRLISACLAWKHYKKIEGKPSIWSIISSDNQNIGKENNDSEVYAKLCDDRESLDTETRTQFGTQNMFYILILCVIKYWIYNQGM